MVSFLRSWPSILLKPFLLLRPFEPANYQKFFIKRERKLGPRRPSASMQPSDSRKRIPDSLDGPSAERNSKRQRRSASNKSRHPKTPAPGSVEDVLLQDVDRLLADRDSLRETHYQPERFSIVDELSIVSLSSVGDGLALSSDGARVFVVPFTIPGDVVRAKVVRNMENHSITDLVEVTSASKDREDSRVFCQYFGRCSGCQFQMTSYDYQLDHKRRVIEKALKHYSGLDPSVLPKVQDVMPSPMFRGYRTKLTPHFDGPRRGGFKDGASTPSIGFQEKGRNSVLDIEDCPIATQPIRDEFEKQRHFVKHNLQTFKRGATILLRESTERVFERAPETPVAKVGLETPHLDIKTCVTDPKALSMEWVGNYKFSSPAGAFFQNNNSILIDFTKFVRKCLDITDELDGDRNDAYLIDAYCGSGLFSICCGDMFSEILGVDISPQSIESATKNALDNGIPNATFIAGKAEALFADVKFPPEQTSVVIDPPRKGCDELFLSQLVELSPKRIVYISCNVHTMARDIGWILSHGSGRFYAIDSAGGFDFFPQTHHVEGYAVLTKRTQSDTHQGHPVAQFPLE